MAENNLTLIANTFDSISSKPEAFITSDLNIISGAKHLLKKTYDFCKQEEICSKNSDALPELITKNFDLEQIWQQIELQNNTFIDESVAHVSKLTVLKNRLIFSNFESESMDSNENLQNESVQNEEVLDNLNKELITDVDVSDSEKSNEDGSVEGEADEEIFISNQKGKKSAVDDTFFKLDEMNAFLESEENKINKGNVKESDSESEGSVNMFEEGSENDNDVDDNTLDKLRNPRYKDFFGDRKDRLSKRARPDDENEDSASEELESMDGDTNEKKVDERLFKSSLEIREERLRKKIQEIEQNAVSEKPWQLKGEITAENRPQNSLLEEVLEYDLGSRPAPVITEETTHLLEDVIRQRIKDKAFDDVERKQKPVETPLEFKKKLVLDQEKSKASLAQIYEKEFVEQQEALNANEEREEEEPPLHQEIKTLMHSLFNNLDALSNFHFTPRPAVPELKIISNLPAINMEEVAPVAASDAALLAPEEVKAKTKGDIIGKGERTATDKRRERRQKRLKQRKHANEKKKKEKLVVRLKPGLGNKYSKEKANKMLDNVTKQFNTEKMNETKEKGIKSSTTFFSELEEEVRSQIKSKTKFIKKINKPQLNAKKVKL